MIEMVGGEKKFAASGFTLVELIVVILLVSVVFVAGLIYMGRSVQNAYLKQGAQQLVNDLVLYSQKTVAERPPQDTQETYFSFSPGSSSYTIYYSGNTITRTLPNDITIGNSGSLVGLTSGANTANGQCTSLGGVYELHIHSDSGTCNNSQIGISSTKVSAVYTVSYGVAGFIRMF